MTLHSRRKQLSSILIILVLLIAWAIRLHRLDFQDIWWDEARNLDVAMRPITQIAGSSELDIHPPLYFYGLHLWTQVVGSLAFTARFFSAWFGVLTAALVYQLGMRLLRGQEGQLVGLLAFILAALAPYALAEAQEIRMYSMSWAILCAGMLALWRALRRPGGDFRQQLKQWAPFTVLLVLALLTHYATAVVLAAWGLWLVAWALLSHERWSRLLTLLGVFLGALLLCLPVLPIALRQITVYDNPNLVLPDLQHYLAELFQAFTLGEFVPASFWTPGRWLWLLVMMVGVLFWVAKGARRRIHSQRWTLLAIWLVGGLAIFYMILVTRSAFNPRYISFVLPSLWALSAWALAGWRRVWRPLPWLLLLLLLALVVPSLRADLYDSTYFREDASGVASYLEANATVEDVILVDQRYPFGHYWERWNNDSYGRPPAEPADQAPAQYLIVDMTHDDERRIDRQLNDLAGSANRIYWVTWFESDVDPRGAVRALLDTGGERIDTKDFRGYKVRVWERDPTHQFRLIDDPIPIGLPFGENLTLVEGDWSGRVTPAESGEKGLTTLRWQVQTPPSRPLKVSLRLKDVTGATVDQDDRVLLNDRHLRTNAWQEGESALNVYSLDLPASPGVYTLTVVVYDEETLEAIPSGQQGMVERELGTVTVES